MRIIISLVLLSLCASVANAAESFKDLRLLVEQNLYAPAALTGNKLLAQGADNEPVLFLTAYAHQMDNQFDRAVELYTLLIRKNPLLPEPRNNLAMIYLAQGDYDRASIGLIEALNTHPSYATAYENLNRIYKGIASEAYRRAISESVTMEKAQYKIELTAIDKLEAVDTVLLNASSLSEITRIETQPREAFLIGQVRRWAEAWSDKDFSRYTGFYATTHHPGLASHEAWIEYRRKRVMRPGNITVAVSKLKVRPRGDSVVYVDFDQRFDSKRYRDRVRKRLVFTLAGDEWKITDERVLSVL